MLMDNIVGDRVPIEDYFANALRQSMGFNLNHVIGEDQRIFYGYRDGGRSVQFDDRGRPVNTPNREIIVVKSPQEDPVLRAAIDHAKKAMSGMRTTQEKAAYLNQYVASLLPQNDPALNEKIMDKMARGSHVGAEISLGDLIDGKTGVCRHRSLLFKVIADEAGIPAAIVRGNFIDPRGSGGHAWNEVIAEDGRRLLVDVMHNYTGDANGAYVREHYFDVADRPLYDKPIPDRRPKAGAQIPKPVREEPAAHIPSGVRNEAAFNADLLARHKAGTIGELNTSRGKGIIFRGAPADLAVLQRDFAARGIQVVMEPAGSEFGQGLRIKSADVNRVSAAVDAASAQYRQDVASLGEILHKQNAMGKVDYFNTSKGKGIIIRGTPNELESIRQSFAARGIGVALEPAGSDFGQGLRIKSDSVERVQGVIDQQHRLAGDGGRGHTEIRTSTVDGTVAGQPAAEHVCVEDPNYKPAKNTKDMLANLRGGEQNHDQVLSQEKLAALAGVSSAAWVGHQSSLMGREVEKLNVTDRFGGHDSMTPERREALHRMVDDLHANGHPAHLVHKNGEVFIYTEKGDTAAREAVERALKEHPARPEFAATKPLPSAGGAIEHAIRVDARFAKGVGYAGGAVAILNGIKDGNVGEIAGGVVVTAMADPEAAAKLGGAVVDKTAQTVKAADQAAGGWLSGAWNSLTSTASSIADKVSGFVNEKTGGLLKDVAETAKTWLGGAVDVAGRFAGGAVEFLGRNAKWLLEGVEIFGKKVPVLGSVITAGFALFEVGSNLVQGDYKKALTAAGAGLVESAGAFLGFGAGEGARELVVLGIQHTAGDDWTPNHSATVQVAMEAYAAVTGEGDHKPQGQKPQGHTAIAVVEPAAKNGVTTVASSDLAAGKTLYQSGVKGPDDDRVAAADLIAQANIAKGKTAIVARG